MSKMSHSYLLCAGVVLSQLAMSPAFAGDKHAPWSSGPRTMTELGFSKYHDVVKGHVNGPDGNPAAGVNVVVKGTTNGTTTDANGDFTINAKQGDVLIISGVGFATQQVKVGSGAINLTLARGTTQLEDVVVTALGIKKQARALGYSTTEVDGSKFTQSRETNVGNALTGQVAGVSVAGDATGPSGSSRVVIRGNASIGQNNQPLYVVDGIPYDNTNQGSAGMWGGQDFGDGLSNISPDDIENITVLKGVSASALYGFRGGNGAILITTKSGQRAKGMSVEVNDNFTANSVVNVTDYQYKYGAGLLGVKPTTAAAAQASPYYSWGALIDGSPSTNFLGNTVPYSAVKNNMKEFFPTGTTNQISVALNGTNEHGHFRLGLNNLNMNTFVPNSGMKQQGVNFNTDYNITKRLSLDLTANYIFEEVTNRVSFSDAPGNVVASVLYVPNTFDIKWEKPGYLPNGYEMSNGNDIYFDNAYFITNKFINTTNRQRLTGGLSLKYKFTDWLNAQAGVSRDGYIFDLFNVVPTGTSWHPGGQLTQDETNFHELNAYANLGFSKNLGQDFTLNAQVGGNAMDNVNASYGTNGVGPFVIPFFYSANNVSNKPFSYTYARYHVNSLYASADLGYKNILFLTATARNDWFSTLNINTDHYLYPSVSGSFIFSDALQLPKWINFGKLRASYGQASNGASPYQNALTYGLQGYSTATGQPIGYVSNSSIPNSLLKPVHIAEQEIGVNMEFFDSRLGVDAALYKKTTTDDIVNVTVSPTSGYSGDYENVGKLRNQGFELLLTGTPIRNRHFAWNISWNFANNNSKVLYLGGAPSIVIGGANPRWGSEVSISNVVGMSYGQIMGYNYTYDAKGNKVFNAQGEPVQTGVVPLGSGVYKQTGGITNEFHYKQLSLSFLVDYKFGAKIYSGTNNLLYTYGLQKTTLTGRENGVIGVGVDQHGNPNTVAVPAQQYYNDIGAGEGDHIAQEFTYDASFIKLRALTIGYNFPASTFKGTFIRGITINLVGRNLATLVKHTPNIDPESSLNNTNGQGLELSGYPPIRSLGANLHVNF